jgi:hypothetical protein
VNPDERRRQLEALLLSKGWDADAVAEVAEEAEENGEPLLETLCFHTLAEQVLIPIHDRSWIEKRADTPESEHHDLIRRLLDAGATAEDLAVFARVMQRQYLSDLGCLLDGAGIHGTPELPIADFRVFAVDDDGKPLVMIDELHESLGFQDLETEMKLSRKAAGKDDEAE